MGRGNPPQKENKCENVVNVLGVAFLWEYLSLTALSIPIVQIAFRTKGAQFGNQDRQFVVILLAFG